MTGAVPGDLLPRVTRLGHGGQGTVWDQPGLRINDRWPVVFKEYSAECRRGLDGPALGAMVDFVPALPPETGRWLCDRLAWPVAAVVDGGGDPLGFLMRRVPEEFFLSSEAVGLRPAGFEFLLNDQGYLDRVGISVTPGQRLRLALDFAVTLGRLHALGLVVGDLSPKNVLFRLEPEPGCFLIDCDSMRLRGRDVLVQRETPSWEVPEGEQPATEASDAHKFGLLMVRLLAGEQDTRDPGAAARVSAELGALAGAALDARPEVRPGVAAWEGPLRRAVDAAVDPEPPPAVARPGPSVVLPTVRPAPPSGPGRQVGRPAPGRPGRVRRRLLVLLAISLLGYGAVRVGPALVRADAAAPGAGRSAEVAPAADSGAQGAAADPARGQAAGLDGLLGRNDGTRRQVTSAVDAVASCSGPASARSAGRTLRTAAGERDELLLALRSADLSAVPGGSRLADRLRDAWTASALADRAFSRWADGVAADGCAAGAVPRGADWDEGVRQSAAATAAKRAFVADWNPLATSFGLTTRDADAI
ncbi:hypothetical protein ACIQ9P_14905 [Kitasatospora sp. NPDC094019]|uniref:hypothetical protein n=1 Tax=Kitasatospora sp. NPDC094019 TaxID=3364091 RepID=UPI00382D729E